MARRWRIAAAGRRSAMTLLEILLTLCLLVVLAGLTWPALGRPLAAQRLRAAADQLRTEWVHARVEAMSNGRPYLFRYVLDGDTYSIEPQAGEDDLAATAVTGMGAAVSPGMEIAEEVVVRPPQQRRLPERVRFFTAQTAADPLAMAASAAGTPSIGIESGMSEPIYFYPDGTCSGIQLRLENEYRQSIELTLRGLTGVVTVSQVGPSEGLVP